MKLWTTPFWIISILSSSLIFANPPVTLSGLSPAISPTFSVGINQTVKYTITNYIPKQLPLTISGFSKPITRITVDNDCQNSLPPAQDVSHPSTCNIGFNIKPTTSEMSTIVSQTLSVNYKGRESLTNTISFKVVNALRAYISNFGNNSISMCIVDSFTGALGTCTAIKDPTFNKPLGMGINTNGTFAYVANHIWGSKPISICPIDPNTGLFGACTAVDGNGVLARANPQRAELNPANTHLYVATSMGNFVFVCPLTNGGASIGTCIILAGNDAQENTTFNNTQDIAFSADGRFAYIANYNNLVSICPVLDDATFGPCTTSGGPSNSDTSTFVAPFGLSFNSTHTILYVANSGRNGQAIPESISACQVSNTSISNCVVSNGNGTLDSDNTEIQLWMSEAFNVGYIPNSGSNTISTCPLKPNGTLGHCSLFKDVSFSKPSSVYIQ